MDIGANWKQLRTVGGKAIHIWTIAFLTVGGPAHKGPIAVPGLGPESWIATHIPHKRQHPHPHKGPNVHY